MTQHLSKPERKVWPEAQIPPPPPRGYAPALRSHHSESPSIAPASGLRFTSPPLDLGRPWGSLVSSSLAPVGEDLARVDLRSLSAWRWVDVAFHVVGCAGVVRDGARLGAAVRDVVDNGRTC